MQALAHVATLARLAVLAAALAFVGLLGIRPSIDDGPTVRAMGLLPACRYDDILTSPRGYADWETTLVDTILRLPKTYAPPDLVRVLDLGVPGKGQVRAVMADDLKAMSGAAAAADATIAVHSPYRSYAQQENVYASWVSYYGVTRARQLSARPGHSEHQLGLAVDFRSEPPVDTLAAAWGTTPAGKWMRNHAWEYGFIMSYPKGTIGKVCYDYEPWHFRYVGRELAAQVHASGLTLREYLWSNFTTAVVPKSTPRPTPRATPVTTSGPAATARPPVPSSSQPVSPSPVAAASAPPPSAAPATAAPVSPAPTLAPTPAASPIPIGPGVPAGPDPEGVAALGPILLGSAGIALGTIVLGGALFVRRRGRSGVGL